MADLMAKARVAAYFEKEFVKSPTIAVSLLRNLERLA
jgi:hypothetical protein